MLDAADGRYFQARGFEYQIGLSMSAAGSIVEKTQIAWQSSTSSTSHTPLNFTRGSWVRVKLVVVRIPLEL